MARWVSAFIFLTKSLQKKTKPAFYSLSLSHRTKFVAEQRGGVVSQKTAPDSCVSFRHSQALCCKVQFLCQHHACRTQYTVQLLYCDVKLHTQIHLYGWVLHVLHQFFAVSTRKSGDTLCKMAQQTLSCLTMSLWWPWTVCWNVLSATKATVSSKHALLGYNQSLVFWAI